MMESGYVRPDNHRAIGLVKLETANLLYDAQDTFFAVKRPTVLYNSHITPGLRSWDTFIEPMLAEFAASDDYNLIVAPHVNSSGVAAGGSVRNGKREARQMSSWIPDPTIPSI